MPDGKPAGVRCVQLSEGNLCKLFGRPERPAVCVGLRPSAEMCGASAGEAIVYLSELELLTRNCLADGNTQSGIETLA